MRLPLAFLALSLLAACADPYANSMATEDRQFQAIQDAYTAKVMAAIQAMQNGQISGDEMDRRIKAAGDELERQGALLSAADAARLRAMDEPMPVPQDTSCQPPPLPDPTMAMPSTPWTPETPAIPMPTVQQPSSDTPAQRLYDCAQQHNCAGVGQ